MICMGGHGHTQNERCKNSFCVFAGTKAGGRVINVPCCISRRVIDVLKYQVNYSKGLHRGPVDDEDGLPPELHNHCYCPHKSRHLGPGTVGLGLGLG